MDLEKTIYINSLYNIYGELLTKKQQEIIESYFFNNLSLAEIAENFKISRQAVLDSINKSCLTLNKYENSLNVLKNNEKVKDLLLKAKTNLSDQNLIKQINKLLDTL